MKQHLPATHFDNIVARFYPLVYKLAAKLNANPISALSMTRRVFQSNRARLSHIHRAREIKAALLASLCVEAIQSPQRHKWA